MPAEVLITPSSTAGPVRRPDMDLSVVHHRAGLRLQLCEAPHAWLFDVDAGTMTCECPACGLSVSARVTTLTCR